MRIVTQSVIIPYSILGTFLQAFSQIVLLHFIKLNLIFINKVDAWKHDTS